MRKGLMGIGAALLLAPMAAQAAPANVAAAVADKERPAEAVKMDESRKPVAVLNFFGLEKGERALDLFAGSGYYTEIMADAVGPKGAVLAWEPANFVDDKSTKEWTELRARVPNARLLISPAGAIPLAPESFDFVLMHMVYHDAYWESAQLTNIRGSTRPRCSPMSMPRPRPGGVVGVVDHVAQPGGDTRAVVDKLHRIDPAVLRADFERAGFVFDGESDLLRNPADDHSKNWCSTPRSGARPTASSTASARPGAEPEPPQNRPRDRIKGANYNEKCYALSSLSLLRREPWQSK